jgi:hypothetical protein
MTLRHVPAYIYPYNNNNKRYNNYSLNLDVNIAFFNIYPVSVSLP